MGWNTQGLFPLLVPLLLHALGVTRNFHRLVGRHPVRFHLMSSPVFICLFVNPQSDILVQRRVDPSPFSKFAPTILSAPTPSAQK